MRGHQSVIVCEVQLVLRHDYHGAPREGALHSDELPPIDPALELYLGSLDVRARPAHKVHFCSLAGFPHVQVCGVKESLDLARGWLVTAVQGQRNEGLPDTPPV